MRALKRFANKFLNLKRKLSSREKKIRKAIGHSFLFLLIQWRKEMAKLIVLFKNKNSGNTYVYCLFQFNLQQIATHLNGFRIDVYKIEWLFLLNSFFCFDYNSCDIFDRVVIPINKWKKERKCFMD